MSALLPLKKTVVRLNLSLTLDKPATKSAIKQALRDLLASQSFHSNNPGGWYSHCDTEGNRVTIQHVTVSWPKKTD